MKPAVRKLIPLALPLAFPLGLVALACLFLARIKNAPPEFLPLVRYSSYAFFFIGLALSYWFNRSRIFFATAALAAGQLALAGPASWDPGRGLQSWAVYSAVCLLLPVNLLVFSLLKERGILSRGGRARALFIAGQVLAVAPLARDEYPELSRLLNAGITGPAGPGLTPVPQLALLAFLVAFAVLAARLLINSSPLEAPFMGTLAAAALALHYRGQTPAGPVFFAAAGLIMATAVIQDSYRKAYLDDLTGLPGRRALREELAKLDGRYSIAMLDIDFFKKVNDTFGHDVGDQVLKFVAAIIREVSGGGRAFRYGGEEFCIIFPGRGLAEAVPHLEALREAVSRRAFVLRGKDRPREKPGQARPGRAPSKKIYITVSIGVSEKADRTSTPEAVSGAADQALYLAKREGRNQVRWKPPLTGQRG